MAYTLYVDDNNILQVKMSDEFTESDLKLYMDDLSKALADFPDDEKMKSFIDTTDLGRVNPTLRRSVGDFMENPKLGKAAVLGNSRIVKVMIDFVLKASGTQHMKYFTDRNEATTWLNTD